VITIYTTKFNIQIQHSAHEVQLSVSYGSQDKQQLFPYTGFEIDFCTEHGVCLLRGTD